MAVNIKYSGRMEYALPLFRECVSHLTTLAGDMHRRGDLSDQGRDSVEMSLKSIAELIFGDGAKVARVKDWQNTGENPKDAIEQLTDSTEASPSAKG